jgi:hypothetical protein
VRGEKQAADNENSEQANLWVHRRRIASPPSSLQFKWTD